MPKPEVHVFVCSQQRPAGHPRGSCGEKGAMNLLQVFSEKLIASGLMNQVSLVATGCLGPCRAGVNVLIYPGATWYMAVTPDNVDQIINQHLKAGSVVEELVAPDALWQ